MEKSSERKGDNERLAQGDDFFKKLGSLDNETYQENVSILSKCDECILYHLEECQKAGVTRAEVLEVVKLTTIGGGSVLYPFARKILRMMDELVFN